MGPALKLPRLVFGPGAIARLGDELALAGIERPLLVSDRGIERAGIVARATGASGIAHTFLDIPENPTARGVDAALAAFRECDCDGIVALGGGSVLDTAKLLSGLALSGLEGAAQLIGKPERIRETVPLIAIPTTVGTGSESSPVAAIHFDEGGPPIGTRGPSMVATVALCDPDLARSLPRHLIAATAIDALSHCIEGFFAEPAHPVIDALALDGIARVFADLHSALEPQGDAARASLMAAAFSGGVAINKGLGPAHAVATACGDQHAHHGTLVALALPAATRLLSTALPDKARRVAAAIGLADGADVSVALEKLIGSLALPLTLPEAGYRMRAPAAMIADMLGSPFNRTSPYAPTESEYRAILAAISG